MNIERASCNNHATSMQQSCNNHATIMQQSRNNHATIMQQSCNNHFFAAGAISFYRGFLSKTLMIHGTAAEERTPSLFFSISFTRSQTFSHLFATLNVGWLPSSFNRTACNYQTVTRWDLAPFRITNHLIDWRWNDVDFYLLDDFILDTIK